MSVRRIFNISPSLHADTPVWPGDTLLSLEPVLRIGPESVVNLSTIRMSLHTGAHVDSPWHFDAGGVSVEDLPLEPFLGPARLVSLQVAGAVRPEQLEELMPLADRLLLRINPGRAERFDVQFNSLGGPAAEVLAAAGVRLFGTDGPSVDRYDSKDLTAHHVLGEAGIQILENLDFEGVPDGDYELISLPLRLVGADASPVRAVLREL